LVGPDRVAAVDSPVRDAPGDRSDDPRELEIELVRAYLGARGRELGLGRAHRGLERLDLFPADGPNVHETPGALELGARILEPCERRGLAGPGLIELGLERPRIDREQQLALLDELA